VGGGGASVVFFAHARPTLAVLWTFPRMFQADAIFAKGVIEVSVGCGVGKTVVVVAGGGQNKSTNAHVNVGRQAHTHTPCTKISDLDDKEGSGSGPRCLKC
jgi:hypothetical protein